MLNQPLAKLAIDNGGRITPLIIPASLTDGTGLMNPSIIFHEGKTIVILRHVNYTIYHSEKKKFLHEWGPLVYLHPEHYQKLKTTNYYCEIDDNGLVSKNLVIDTSLLDVEPLWEFVGLEDARIVYWDNKIYLSGVRRDTTTNGQGRIELSELSINNYSVKEIKRYRIEPPIDKDSYCEKNWMPVLDKPFHYVKWTNPTELVKVDINNLSSEQVYVGEYRSLNRDLRGGSQVIPWKDYYITITHEVDLFNDFIGRKDGIYRHRIVLWDKNFVKIGWSDDFSFLGGDIEFCAGMAFKDEHFYITFGFQDNSACLLKVPENLIKGLLNI
jgi:hypothetical protein